jgi:hypothetical protein
MHQFEQAQPNKQQQQAFYDFEYGNYGETGLVRARRHGMKSLSHATRKRMWRAAGQ